MLALAEPVISLRDIDPTEVTLKRGKSFVLSGTVVYKRKNHLPSTYPGRFHLYFLFQCSQHCEALQAPREMK
jgi:hypothetical protein